MDDQEKQAIIARSMGTRRGRKELAWRMTQPISPGMRHPCIGCGHWENNNFCENLVHATADREKSCWHPGGTLAVADERKGRK